MRLLAIITITAMANLYLANAKLSPDATACEIKQKFFSSRHDALKEAYKWENCGPDIIKRERLSKGQELSWGEASKQVSKSILIQSADNAR